MRVHLGDESAQIFSNNQVEIREGRLVVQYSGKIKLPSDFCNMVSSVAEVINKVSQFKLFAINIFTVTKMSPKKQQQKTIKYLPRYQVQSQNTSLSIL